MGGEQYPLAEVCMAEVKDTGLGSGEFAPLHVHGREIKGLGGDEFTFYAHACLIAVLMRVGKGRIGDVVVRLCFQLQGCQVAGGGLQFFVVGFHFLQHLPDG
ncbi:hypothetical protein Barb7_01555 [Bacteroidales bacterium Barb7]|nr:hypothetical protein Barb7_01555 [Bacteroidales bacterium Barb7]